MGHTIMVNLDVFIEIVMACQIMFLTGVLIKLHGELHAIQIVFLKILDLVERMIKN